jgi:hypothetical protein
MAKKKDAEVYDVPALVITPEKAPVVTGNYEAIESVLQKWNAKVSSKRLTEDNMDEVLAIKKAAVAVRNQIDVRVDATKKLLFNDPKKIFEARMKSLYSLIAGVEGAADKVLTKLEQERVDDINQVLDNYKAKFQEQYKLDEPNLARVEYKKNYYNKTADEKARKLDLEQQFKDLRKAQDAHAANVRLITATCKEEPRLNLQHWIDMLQTEDVATITEEIVAEKQRLRELDKQQTETETSSASSPGGDIQYEILGAAAQGETGEKITIGVPAHIDFSTDFPDRRKQMQIEFDYACDQGDALSEYFEEQRKYLKQFGIKIKQVRKEVVF